MAELDSDGLVTTRRRPWHEGPEVPMWQDDRFVAVLDPYELSDGAGVLEVRAANTSAGLPGRRCSAPAAPRTPVRVLPADAQP